MPNLGKEDRAARRRERRRKRRENQKSSITNIPQPASAGLPMIYDWVEPTTLKEGYKSTAGIVKKPLTLSPSKNEEEYLNITCYGKFSTTLQPNGSYRDFVVDYYVPMIKFSALAKKKGGVSSVDVINRYSEKVGTMKEANGRIAFMVRKDELVIAGDFKKETLAEAIHERLSADLNTIVREIPKGISAEQEHTWEKRVGVFAPNQVQETTLYRCTTCGARYRSVNPAGFPPTMGCFGEKNGA